MVAYGFALFICTPCANYDIIGAKEKQATAKQAFVFLAVINEQMFDAVKRSALKAHVCEFIRYNNLKDKQAAAKQIFAWFASKCIATVQPAQKKTMTNKAKDGILISHAE